MIFPRSIRVLFVCLATVAGSVLPAFAQQTGVIVGTATSSDGAGLPGVTVEARSAVLPAPRSTVTEENGDYRLPALPPGAYTVTFTLSGMATVTRQVEVQLALETRIDATLGIAGVTEAVEVTASTGLVDRSVGHAEQRHLVRAAPRRAGGAAVSRPAQADSRRPVQPGHDPRPQRRRQRPGQRLPVRWRQRDAAAVRHALRRTGVARHRPGDGHPRRRARRRFRSRRRLHDRFGQQVRHQQVLRPGQLPVPAEEDDRGDHAATRCRITRATRPGRTSTWADRCCPRRSSSTPPTSGPPSPAPTTPTSTASCRNTSRPATKASAS